MRGAMIVKRPPQKYRNRGTRSEYSIIYVLNYNSPSHPSLDENV